MMVGGRYYENRLKSFHCFQTTLMASTNNTHLLGRPAPSTSGYLLAASSSLSRMTVFRGWPPSSRCRNRPLSCCTSRSRGLSRDTPLEFLIYKRINNSINQLLHFSLNNCIGTGVNKSFPFPSVDFLINLRNILVFNGSMNIIFKEN